MFTSEKAGQKPGLPLAAKSGNQFDELELEFDDEFELEFDEEFELELEEEFELEFEDEFELLFEDELELEFELLLDEDQREGEHQQQDGAQEQALPPFDRGVFHGRGVYPFRP